MYYIIGQGENVPLGDAESRNVFYNCSLYETVS